MWPIIMGFMRTYAVYITWPVAAMVGVIGYNLEGYIRKDKNTPWRVTAIKDDREERKLGELDSTEVETLKSKKDIPKTILDRNDFPKTQ